MSFREIKGQEEAVRCLKSAIKNNRIAHAYIFAGPRNSGRSLLAKNFAKALNCADPEDFPCDACASCVKIDKSVHPDVKLLTYGGKGGDIIIDEIRKLEREIIFKPYEGRYKVFIIEDAHRMNAAAANSFLKTLEEPPLNSVLILITEKPSDLVPTIASRCQIIRVKPLSAEDLARVLASEYGIGREKAESLARICEGRIGKAITYGDEILTRRDRALERFSDDKLIENFNAGDREGLIYDLSLLAGWYRDILVYKATQDRNLVINFDRVDDIKREEKLSRADELLAMFENVLKAKDEIQNNINPKLALSAILRQT